MRTSIVFTLALFGAGALAHPTLQKLHLHHKRQQPDPIREWDEGNVHYEEYVQTETYVVPNGGAKPPSQPQSSPADIADDPPLPQKNVKNYQGNSGDDEQQDDRPQQQSPTTTKQQASPQKTSQSSSVQSATSVEQQASPQKTSQPPVQSATSVKQTQPQSTNTGGSGGGSCSTPNIVGGEASAWATNPCSQGKSILDSFNDMRAKWIPSLGNSKYTWDEQLAANARLTAVSPVSVNAKGDKENEGGATEMHHALYDGSQAQCIASGDGTTMSDGLTPFEKAAQMWLCEIPQGDIGCEEATNGGDTGHAEIIKNTKYTKVGCYYMDAQGPAPWEGEWTCDFAS
ncbi:MAG: hypothetical protein Q9217_007047 [Psora testacea]